MEISNKKVGMKARRSKDGLQLETFKICLVLIMETMGEGEFDSVL